VNLRLEAVIHGRVQGVFFRRGTLEEARRLKLTGTVRNLPDGTVRVLAEGEREPLEALLAWLRHGPEFAWVDSVDVVWGDASGEWPAFRIVG
jgi:acylphosphatase